MAALTLEDMHDLADANDTSLSVLRLAVPNAPAHSLDLRDDHRLRLHPLGSVRRQSDGSLRSVLHPHGDMKPIKNRRFCDPALARIDRRPEQPSVNAVTAVSVVQPTL